MALQYAILGLLSWQPFSGYDLKKIISDSDLYYWSGNNNQIYRTLVELHEAGYVTVEVQQQESLPARKIYSITPEGRLALRAWVLSTPDLPELHNTFLIQLAWAGDLPDDTLDELLQRYENEIGIQLQMARENARRGLGVPNRTPREAFLWARISENITSSYKHELEWVRATRKELKESGGKRDHQGSQA